MKRSIALMLAAALLLCFAACAGKKEKPEDQTAPDQQNEENAEEALEEVAVMDAEGNRIGSIRPNGAITLTDAGIFYSVLSDSAKKAEFRLFDPETGENASLGRIEDFAYEASYCRLELGGKIYTLVQTGNLFDSAPDPLTLLEFDPANGGMKEYCVEENGFAYSAMAAVNGKLLIIDHDQEDVLHDRLIEFDPASGEMSEKLSFELDESGDTLRGVCAHEGGFYLLRVQFDGGKKMFLDKYDGSFRLIESEDISYLIKSAADSMTPEEAEDEFNQWVSRFFVTEDGVLYYESFSVLRCLAVLDSGEQLIIANDLFNASSGSGEPVFLWIYGGSDGNEKDVFELRDKKLAVSEKGFELPNQRYFYTFASASESGNRLIFLGSDETLPPLLYYIPRGR